MKYITLIRHAKSNWGDFLICDHHRPLCESELEVVPLVGKYFNEQYLDRNKVRCPIPFPNLFISSTAVRAIETARSFKAAIESPSTPVRLLEEEELYQARPESYLRIIRGLTDDLDHVMIFGHNPTISEVLQRLKPTEIEDELTTCGGVILQLPWPAWSAVDWGDAERIGSFSPRVVQKRNKVPLSS